MVPSSESWPVWLWGRLLLLAVSNSLAIYILTDNNLVMTSWKVENTNASIVGRHTATCRKVIGEGFEKNYCLSESKVDSDALPVPVPLLNQRTIVDETQLKVVGVIIETTFKEFQEYPMVSGSGTFKCTDDYYKQSFVVDSDGGFSSELLPMDGICCDRIEHAHSRLIAGCSFVVAAMIVAALAIFGILQPFSAYVCFAFSAVATGLLGSALELSDTNGVWTCNDEIEKIIKGNVLVTKTLVTEDYDGVSEEPYDDGEPIVDPYYPMEEKREEGFWVLLALVVTLGVLVLFELIMLASNYLKPKKAEDYTLTKLGNLIF